ncbi:MAG: isoprenylcysteine carboxylmethyltransferase family protein [Bacteroidetes bacterium]|nr:isoprenylcysteine carboxylmethyltransferase family protein [Bacteroidota bacterium]
MEQATERNWKEYLFTYRSYTPIPFLIVMVIFSAPTVESLVIGLVLALAGELIRLWGVSYAGSETRTTGAVGGTHLITSGPYAYVRNPLYIGNILMYFGIGVMANALMPYLPLVALVYFAFQYSSIVRLEETYLSSTFSNWQEYASNVRRFVPRLSRFNGGGTLKPNLGHGLRSERSSLLALSSISVFLVLIFIYRNIA